MMSVEFIIKNDDPHLHDKNKKRQNINKTSSGIHFLDYNKFYKNSMLSVCLSVVT